MDINDLRNLLLIKEAGKHQINVADMSEALAALADLMGESDEQEAAILAALVRYSRSRRVRKNMGKKR